MSPATIIFSGVFLVAAIYCGTGPLGHSSMVEFPGFATYPVEFAPFSEVAGARDGEDLLQKAEVKFLNEVQGPESVVFDPMGRGPYTGVADGRILLWNGEAWTDFAHTSPNRTFRLSSLKLPQTEGKDVVCAKWRNFMQLLFTSEPSG